MTVIKADKKKITKNSAVDHKPGHKTLKLRGVKSAWIYFCNERRPIVVADNPVLSFGDVCKHLAPTWNSMSEEERAPYKELYLQDKQRFANDILQLSDSDKKALRLRKKQLRLRRRHGPKPVLSPYMFFVLDKRQDLVATNPGADFITIGKLLGSTWNNLTEADKYPFVRLSQIDRDRYQKQIDSSKNVAESITVNLNDVEVPVIG